MDNNSNSIHQYIMLRGDYMEAIKKKRLLSVEKSKYRELEAMDCRKIVIIKMI